MAEALERLLTMLSAARPESNPLFLFGVPDAVEAAVRTDRLGEVVAHVDRLKSWLRESLDPVGLALLARCQGLIEQRGAERHFARALELGAVLSPFDQGRTELLYGEWLRRQRRRVDARRHLRTALELFERLGAEPWEARAHGAAGERRDRAQARPLHA